MVLLYEGVIANERAARYGGQHEKLMEIFNETSWSERTIGEMKTSVKYFENVMYITKSALVLPI